LNRGNLANAYCRSFALANFRRWLDECWLPLGHRMQFGQSLGAFSVLTHVAPETLISIMMGASVGLHQLIQVIKTIN